MSVFSRDTGSTTDNIILDCLQNTQRKRHLDYNHRGYDHLYVVWTLGQRLLGEQKGVLCCCFCLTRRSLFGPDGIALRGALEAGGP